MQISYGIQRSYITAFSWTTMEIVDQSTHTHFPTQFASVMHSRHWSSIHFVKSQARSLQVADMQVDTDLSVCICLRICFMYLRDETLSEQVNK